MRCAVQWHCLSVGANSTRQLSRQPVAIGAVVMNPRMLALLAALLIMTPAFASADVISLQCTPEPNTYQGPPGDRVAFTASEHLWIDTAKQSLVGGIRG